MDGRRITLLHTWQRGSHGCGHGEKDGDIYQFGLCHEKSVLSENIAIHGNI